MKQPNVSIIITTKNEARVIEKLLKSITSQSYKNYEIIVVDNNSDDSTLKIANKYTKHVYTYGPERSTQRNYGVKKSRGKYVLILDADMKLSKHVLQDLVHEIVAKKSHGGVIIPEISIATNFWERVKAFERSFYNATGDAHTDAARFFSKKAFSSVKGYDESITGPEDWDLPERIMKKGYSIGRINSPIYHQEKIPSIWNLARKKYYYALSSHRYLKKHNISPLSAKTIYFLRPALYKNPKKLLFNPHLTVGMFTMFFIELAAGGIGFITGKLKNI